MRVQLSECFEIVTEESAAEGEAADRGFVREREIVSVREALEALRECAEPSSSPIDARRMSGHEWASTEPSQDMRTGAYESQSIHIAREDGRPMSGRSLFRMFRAAGLASGRL